MNQEKIGRVIAENRKAKKLKQEELAEKLGIIYDEFLNVLTRTSETTVLLSKFNTKGEAVEYLMNETNLSYEECSKAYDSYIGLNQKR